MFWDRFLIHIRIQDVWSDLVTHQLLFTRHLMAFSTFIQPAWLLSGAYFHITKQTKWHSKGRVPSIIQRCWLQWTKHDNKQCWNTRGACSFRRTSIQLVQILLDEKIREIELTGNQTWMHKSKMKLAPNSDTASWRLIWGVEVNSYSSTCWNCVEVCCQPHATLGLTILEWADAQSRMCTSRRWQWWRGTSTKNQLPLHC